MEVLDGADRGKSRVRRWTYRVWQALTGLWPRISEVDRAEARAWLSERQFALWAQQTPRDQRHSLRVLRLLRAWGWEARPLMQAALLHDVGKSVTKPTLWHRTVWVLAGALAPRWRSFLIRKQGWRRPFWVLAEHPRLGAEMARAAGCDEEVVWLIAHHQEEKVNENSARARWWQALKRADQRS